MSSLRKIIIGSFLIVGQASLLGLAGNALRHDPLPLIRKPLSETRRVATSNEVFGSPAKEQPEPNHVSPDIVKPASVPVAHPDTAKSAIPKTLDRPVPAPQVSSATAAKQPQSLKKAEALFTTLSDAKKLYDQKSAIFLDARHQEDYDEEHISGAKSLFVDDLDSLSGIILSNVPKDHTIVTYCSDSQCEAATNLADKLVEKGYTHVLILLEGLPGWKDAGYPTAGGIR